MACSCCGTSSAPPRDAYILLELPDQPSRGDAIADLSDADLLVRFANTARPLDKGNGPGFFLEELDARVAGTRLFRLSHKWATEFVLRKDYRRDWDVELLEEYSYFTADEFAEELNAAGGRLLCAEPYWNPWIVRNRFEGKFRLLDESGNQLGWPPTNFVAVAQRVTKGSSVRLGERRASQSRPSFLTMAAMRNTGSASGQVYDLVKRPNPVCDLIPWRRERERLRVAARYGYPRPITCAVPRGPTMIDGSKWGGYLIEPLTGMVPQDAAPEAIGRIIAERAMIAAEDARQRRYRSDLLPVARRHRRSGHIAVHRSAHTAAASFAVRPPCRASARRASCVSSTPRTCSARPMSARCLKRGWK